MNANKRRARGRAGYFGLRLLVQERTATVEEMVAMIRAENKRIPKDVAREQVEELMGLGLLRGVTQ